jgi:hypothetical protein
MPNDTKQIHNVETGEIQIIELTDEEQAIKDAQDEANLNAKLAAAEAKAAVKAAAETKLAALGLTVEDLQALGL